jgi:hypothetical protein
MPCAYIARLKRELLSDADQPPAVPTLRNQLLEWFEGLPEISRTRPFAMVELEKALGTQGKYLSPILLSLGWSRKRKWLNDRQYHRYWLPPAYRHISR